MISEKIKFSDGKIWSVASGHLSINSPVVIVPINQLDNLSDAEIGSNVREAIYYARFCSALEKADWVTAYGKDVRRCYHNLDNLLAAKVLLNEFVHESDPLIQSALEFIAEVEGYVARKELEKTKIRAKKAGYVYLISGGGYFKIGQTQHIEKRIKQVGTKLPFKIEYLHWIETNDMDGLEAYWHQYFVDKREEGEWFTLSDEEVEKFCEKDIMNSPNW
jgi:hypothetical protein